MITCMCKIRHPQVIEGFQDYLALSFYVECKYFIVLIKKIISIYFLTALGLSCDTWNLCCHMQGLWLWNVRF